MEKLAQIIAEKTGLSEEMAAMAAQVAFDFFKERLPEGVGSQLEQLVDGDFDLGDVAATLPGGLGKMAGSLFGGDD